MCQPFLFVDIKIINMHGIIAESYSLLDNLNNVVHHHFTECLLINSVSSKLRSGVYYIYKISHYNDKDIMINTNKTLVIL